MYGLQKPSWMEKSRGQLNWPFGPGIGGGYCKKLEGECDGLYELRFKADKVQQRPLGLFLSDSIFVILLWATEKNDRFVPKAACEIALRRKVEVLANEKCAHALWLALE
jgi:hypothetical protein